MRSTLSRSGPPLLVLSLILAACGGTTTTPPPDAAPPTDTPPPTGAAPSATTPMQAGESPSGPSGGVATATVELGGDTYTLDDVEVCNIGPSGPAVSMRDDAGVRLTVQAGGGNAPIRLSGVAGETWGAAGMSSDDTTVVEFEVTGRQATWAGQLTGSTSGQQQDASVVIDCGG